MNEIQKCRESFEKWVGVPSILYRKENGEYEKEEIRNDWRVWRASWYRAKKSE